jgi:hypothetical protein
MSHQQDQHNAGRTTWERSREGISRTASLGRQLSLASELIGVLQVRHRPEEVMPSLTAKHVPQCYPR